MLASHCFEVTEESQVGEVRRFVQNACLKWGDETFTGKAAIVVTEMGHNLVKHGGGGEIIIREDPHAHPAALEFLALDSGGGIENVAESLRDGFSTSGTAGSGLGSIKRLSDEFELYTLTDRGTAMWARLSPGRSTNGKSEAAFEYGGVCVCLEHEVVCGDSWDVLPTPQTLRIIVADGLGHGPFAQDASQEAVLVFRKYPKLNPAELLELTHKALGKTRGAAASVVEIDLKARTATGAGVGNVVMRVVHVDSSKFLTSDNGTLGANMRRVLPTSVPWQSTSLIVVHSDGVSTGWNMEKYPGLASKHPSLIAGVLFRDFRRKRDDATVVVARQRSVLYAPVE